MSRTYRTISHLYKQEREDILNNELIYPYDTNYYYKFSSLWNKKEIFNGRFTDWDRFFSCKYYHGYDGSISSCLSGASSRYPKGHDGVGSHNKKRLYRKYLKQRASHARRLYAKYEIQEILREGS